MSLLLLFAGAANPAWDGTTVLMPAGAGGGYSRKKLLELLAEIREERREIEDAAKRVKSAKAERAVREAERAARAAIEAVEEATEQHAQMVRQIAQTIEDARYAGKAIDAIAKAKAAQEYAEQLLNLAIDEDDEEIIALLMAMH